MPFSFHRLTYASTYIIAEAGVNHDGCLEKAFALVDAALHAKANAVKFQLFDATALSTATAPKSSYQIQNDTHAQAEESQQAMLKRLALSTAEMQAIHAYATRQGIEFLCSPFDLESANALTEDFQLPFLKLGSGELTNFPLLKPLAEKQTPLLLSTGMATLAEVLETHQFLAPYYGDSFTDAVAYLHCTSQYPAPFNALNLKAILTLKEALTGHVVGYSDHSLAVEHIPAMAIALGARLYEKHLTLDATATTGPDHQASLEAKDFTVMVQRIREAELALGSGLKIPHACEIETRNVARKSVVLTQALSAGTTLEASHLSTKRPAAGISASRFYHLIGKRLKISLPADVVLREDLLEDGLGDD